MKAIKFLLLPALALGLVLGWVLWLGSVQVGAPGGDAADQGSVPLVTSEPLRYSYSDHDSPPKLDLPDKITATVEPEAPSPFTNADTQLRRAAQLGTRVLKDPAGFEDSFEFRDSTRIRTDWQTPPRLNLKPAGRSTPFSKPDWDDHPPLDRILDGRPIPKPRSGP